MMNEHFHTITSPIISECTHSVNDGRSHAASSASASIMMSFKSKVLTGASSGTPSINVLMPFDALTSWKAASASRKLTFFVMSLDKLLSRVLAWTSKRREERTP